MYVLCTELNLSDIPYDYVCTYLEKTLFLIFFDGKLLNEN